MENATIKTQTRFRKKALSGAAVIAGGGFLAKIFGAAYRVLLTALLGVEGLGTYQMVFPVYCAMLDISSSGVPASASKLISERIERKNEVLNVSLLIFGLFGVACSVFTAAFSKSLAAFQGDRSAYFAYVIISPSIALVAVLACFKGYFQGQGNTCPTALSQIVEQAVKVLCGYFGIKAVVTLKSKVTMAVFAVTASEIAAVILMLVIYVAASVKERGEELPVGLLYDENGQMRKADKIKVGAVIFSALPVMLAGLAFPLSDVFESAIVLRGFGSANDALSVYGVYAGAVKTFINLPVSLCYGLAVVAVPLVAGKKSLSEKYSTEAVLVLSTLVISAIGAAACFLFAPIAVKILFPSLGEYASLAVGLIRISSVTVIFAALTQTTNAVLIAKGKTVVAVISCFTGVAIKTVLSYQLVFIAKKGIFAVAVTSILCYLVAVLINLKYTLTERKKKDG